MSKSKTTQQALNRAYSELSLARHVSKENPLSKLEYRKVLDCFGVLGKMRSDYLDRLELENAA